jgi:hypothetical protein
MRSLKLKKRARKNRDLENPVATTAARQDEVQ